MVRIIKQGTIPENQPIQTDCNHCSTVFEFLPFEAQYNHDQRDGDYYSIACPTCKRTCTHSKPGYFGPG